MNRRLAVAALLALCGLAQAQTACNRPVGPDAIIGDITAAANYAAANGRDAFGLGFKVTNVGSAQVNFFANTPMHPVFADGLFRLQSVDGAMRFEQIGQAWNFHGFFALSTNGPCASCQPGDGAHLGVSCSDPETASITSSQNALGPRWQVNPSTGLFPYPPASPSFSGSIARRLQADAADLAVPAQFFVEILTVAADDAAAGNGNNNASYRPCTLSGGPTEFNMALSGTTVTEQPAISAWSQADPAVTQTSAQADGLFIISSRATQIPGGWHYEFAVYNMNSDAGGGSFSVPLPDTASLSNVGFHDVDYTDGDGLNNVTRDGSDWRATRGAAHLTWAATPYATDPNGNGLLWGTLYNFRFDSDAPPNLSGAATLTLWKNSAQLSIPAQVPGAAPVCYANCDGSTTQPILNVNDFICFQTQFASGASYANCDGSTIPPVLNINDFICFQTQFAAGCQ